MRTNIKISIKKTIQHSYIIIIAILLIPLFMGMSVSVWQTSRYDRVITNVCTVNNLNQIVTSDITNETWDIVAGNKSFFKGSQFLTIRDITEELKKIEKTTGDKKNTVYLSAAKRVLDTLTKKITMLGIQMANSAPVERNEQMLEEIRGMTALVHDILQEYIVNELQYAAEKNERIKQNVKLLIIIQLLLVLSVLYFAVRVKRSLSANIEAPIQHLEELSNQIASGDFSARAQTSNVTELDSHTSNFNIMAGKLDRLLEQNIREQQNLQKAEIKALQAQITPQFLHNTLGAVIGLAEAKKTEQIIDITRGLSSFLSLAIGSGSEWITVGQEFEHVRSYLSIQKMGFSNILDYSAEFEQEMKEKPVLKLLLQPLVENAVCHGIKNKLEGGSIKVRAWEESGLLCFLVEDNGAGMTEQRLAEVQQRLPTSNGPNDADEKSSGMYGLFNVYRRLHLFYGDSVTFELTSAYGSGTSVFFAVPEKHVTV